MMSTESLDCQTPLDPYFPPVSTPMIDSPCIKLCILNAAGDHCIGCGRSLTEIAGWTGYSDTQRAGVIADLPRRLLALRTAPSSSRLEEPRT